MCLSFGFAFVCVLVVFKGLPNKASDERTISLNSHWRESDTFLKIILFLLIVDDYHGFLLMFLDVCRFSLNFIDICIDFR